MSRATYCTGQLFFFTDSPVISTPIESPVRDNASNGVNQHRLISLIYVLNQYIHLQHAQESTTMD